MCIQAGAALVAPAVLDPQEDSDVYAADDDTAAEQGLPLALRLASLRVAMVCVFVCLCVCV